MTIKEGYLETFLENYALAERQSKSLAYSWKKLEHFIPALVNTEELTDDEKEALDAFLLRYSKFEDFLFKRLIRSLAKLEGLKFQKSDTDQLMRYMYEKGIVPDPDFWLKQAELRNVLIHEYPEEAV